MFDPALHAAAVAERGPGAPVMAPGWWSSVTCPEDPRALELRHIPDLPARDAARITGLFAEVVDAGGGCVGEAWEVLSLWELGTSPSAAAAGQAVMILVARAAEADVAAGLADDAVDQCADPGPAGGPARRVTTPVAAWGSGPAAEGGSSRPGGRGACGAGEAASRLLLSSFLLPGGSSSVRTGTGASGR